MSDSTGSGLRVVAEAATTPGGAKAMVTAFEGELDLATLPGFEEAIADAEALPVVIDLGEVSFIDSSGIHGIVRARMAHAERGLGLELVVAPGSAVDRVLEMTGLRDRLAPKPDRVAALAALDGEAAAGDRAET